MMPSLGILQSKPAASVGSFTPLEDTDVDTAEARSVGQDGGGRIERLRRCVPFPKDCRPRDTNSCICSYLDLARGGRASHPWRGWLLRSSL